jgi:hypothetical protein
MRTRPGKPGRRTRRGARTREPLRFAEAAGASGERRLADFDQHVMAYFSSEYVIDLLEPGKLGLQVVHTLLKATHL